MKNTFLLKMHSGPSSICRELIENTKAKKISWVSYEAFIEYLEIQGIAFDDIRWFYSYLMHIQNVRHYPSYSETYFTFFEHRLFAISQSKFSREFRIDFTSSFDKSCVWRGIIDSQSSLFRLHSYVQITNSEDSKEECEELLYATDCIHA